MKINYLLILIMLIQFNWISAQVSYNYKLYTTEDGLISDNCYKLFQDSKGYLWIANGNGMSKFNGKEFKNVVDKDYKNGNWIIDQFVEKNENELLVSSPKISFNPNLKAYLFNDSSFKANYFQDKWIGFFYPQRYLDKDFYKIFGVNEKNKISNDTINFLHNNKFNQVIIPSKMHNSVSSQLIDNKNNVYIKVLDTLDKNFSYYVFNKGSLNFILKSKDSFFKIERDLKQNIIGFYYNKSQCISYYNSKGKFINTRNYIGLTSAWSEFDCFIDQNNFIWIPSSKGILKINENNMKEFVDVDRKLKENIATNYDENGNPYSYKNIIDVNYKYLKIINSKYLINGDRLFDGKKFMDLMPNILLSKTSKDLINGEGIDDMLCDREKNIWMATSIGLMKFTPIPYRSNQNYLSKKEIEFKLEHTDGIGRKFFVKTDLLKREFYLKIYKDTSLLFSKTYKKTPLDINKVGLDEILKFEKFGNNTIMIYNSNKGKYSICLFSDREYKQYDYKEYLYCVYRDSINLFFTSVLNSKLININSKSITEIKTNRFYISKLQLYDNNHVFNNANKILGSNFTICQIKSNFDIDTFAYGNLPLKVRYNVSAFCKIKLLNYEYFVLDKEGDVYLANEYTHEKLLNPNKLQIQNIIKSNKNGYFKAIILKDLILLTNNKELLALKFDSINKKISYFNNFTFANGLLSMYENTYYTQNNYLLLSAPSDPNIQIFSYNEIIKNGLIKPINIKVPQWEDWLITDTHNYLENILTDSFFNKQPPLININEISYSYNSERLLDTTSNHNFSSSISNLTFNYDAVSLTEGDYIQTKYNVLGFDTTWQEINTNEIVFSSLPPGIYTLQIKACNNHNFWSEPKQITFSIDYPWYRTWFAYILYIVVGGGAIYLFIKSRTKKLEKEKENLEKIVEERTAEVVEEKKVITEQKHLIEEKHREITDSINYAERIQRSFLATKEQLDEQLNDYFVLFQPKDVVSGDFYWAHTLQNGNFALVTADSTGHGVPGAIMSLLNTSSLEKAVELGISEPAEILNSTRKTIIDRLKKDGSAEGGKDGMDCSLISFNNDKSKLIYSAANNPIWIIRENTMIELQPDKIPVGKHDRDSVSFTQHEIDLQKGDMIYTLTDGFPDQFGGPKGKKFMYKKLKEILMSISNKPLNEQHEFLKNSLNDWMGNTEQVDDITVIGIRV